MELAIQFLDEIEDLVLIAGRIWQTIAWKIAGLLGVLVVSLLAALPL